MPIGYRAVDDEKFYDESPIKLARASTAESLASTLLEQDEESRDRESARRSSGRWMWLVHAVLLSLSFGMFVTSYYTKVSTRKYVEAFSAWSPAAEAVSYKDIKYNVTKHSPYVGKGPDVDAAWSKITYEMGDQMITADQLNKIDMPDTMLKVKHPKTGIEGYRVGLEVFHQLHCIDLLRQVTYHEWYEDISGEFLEGREHLQMHTDHCLEILRLAVQCTSDVGVFTLYLEDGDPLPWPELNTWHTCRNFDAVADWAMQNTVGTMERPDVKPLVETPGNATSDQHLHGHS